MVKAGAGGQEGHTTPAVDASICSSLCQAAFEEVLGVNKGGITKSNKYSPQKSTLGHKVLRN